MIYLPIDQSLTTTKSDPHELHNIYHQTHNLSLISLLDALLIVLKTCKARQCTHPWEVLHPGSNIRSLKDAMSPGFDAFYNAQTKLYWTQCEQAYVAESEGPEGVQAFMWHEVAL